MSMIESAGHVKNGMIVDENGRAQTKSMTLTCQQITNREDKESYSIVVKKTPTTANDCFLYIKNTSNKDMLISSVQLSCAAADVVEIKLDEVGTPVGGSKNTPINRNSGSGRDAECDCEDGVDITGLSNGAIVEQLAIEANKVSAKFKWDSKLIIPKNKTVTFYAVTGGNEIRMTASMSFCV